MELISFTIGFLLGALALEFGWYELRRRKHRREEPDSLPVPALPMEWIESEPIERAGATYMVCAQCGYWLPLPPKKNV